MLNYLSQTKKMSFPIYSGIATLACLAKIRFSPIWQPCLRAACGVTCKSVRNANFVRSSHGQSPHCGI